MTRFQQILAALLVVQLLAIFAFRTASSSEERDGAPTDLLPGFSVEATTRIEIRGSESERVVTLEREGDAGWAVAQLQGFPADATKVRDLLDQLDGQHVRRPVVSSDRYHETFRVATDENEGRVTVWAGEGDEPVADLILGTSPNYRTLHVRRADDDRVWEVRGLSSWEVSPETGFWIRKEVLDVDAGEVASLSISNASGTLDLERVDGAWRLAGDEDGATALDQEAIDELVRKATELRFLDGIVADDPASLGLDPPAAVVTLRTGAVAGAAGESDPRAREVVLEVGGEVEDKQTQRYARRAGSRYAGTAWSNALDAMLTADAGSLGAS